MPRGRGTRRAVTDGRRQPPLLPPGGDPGRAQPRPRPLPAGRSSSSSSSPPRVGGGTAAAAAVGGRGRREGEGGGGGGRRWGGGAPLLRPTPSLPPGRARQPGAQRCGAGGGRGRDRDRDRGRGTGRGRGRGRWLCPARRGRRDAAFSSTRGGERRGATSLPRIGPARPVGPLPAPRQRRRRARRPPPRGPELHAGSSLPYRGGRPAGGKP